MLRCLSKKDKRYNIVINENQIENKKVEENTEGNGTNDYKLVNDSVYLCKLIAHGLLLLAGEDEDFGSVCAEGEAAASGAITGPRSVQSASRNEMAFSAPRKRSHSSMLLMRTRTHAPTRYNLQSAHITVISRHRHRHTEKWLCI